MLFYKNKIQPSKYTSILLALCLSIGLMGCKEDVVLSPQQVSGTENGTMTLSGRYFIAANLNSTTEPSSIMEITKDSDGNYQKTVVLEGNFAGQSCTFNGLTSYKNTLYAACTFSGLVPGIPTPIPLSSLLIQIETNKDITDPSRVQMQPLLGIASLPNGMAADSHGDLYITDSNAWLATYTAGINNPAIVKVSINNDAGFSANVTPWYYAGADDYFPNGIRVRNNRVFYVSSTKIKRFNVNSDGTPGDMNVIYTADECELIDDFDITFQDYIVATEVGLYDPFYSPIMWPGIDCTGKQLVGKLIGISGKYNGRKLGEYVFKDGTLPSSAVFVHGFLFKPDSVVTTAYFTGGVQTVSVH